MGACCQSDVSTNEFDTAVRPSMTGKPGPDDQMTRLIKVQAFVRGYLHRRKYRMLKANPTLYEELYPDLVSMKESSIPYFSEAVQEMITQLGVFGFEDD